MKKLILCFVAIATMAAVSCKKETNPAEDFVGNYTVKTSAHLTIPVIGNMDQDLDDMEFLNVKRYSADEIEELISSGNFQQAVHMLAWFLSNGR